jgi:hypothetical protein
MRERKRKREVGSTEFYCKAQRKNILQALPFCELTAAF